MKRSLYINHFFSFLGAAFLPFYSVGAVVVAATFSGRAIGVKRPCLLCCSVDLIAPESTSCLRTNRAIDPTTLNFSITCEAEICFPNLGIPVISLS
jgi:hypothetical protein